MPSHTLLTTNSQLNHPHIVRYLGIHKDKSGTRYIVTEYVGKGSLASVINADRDKLKTDDLLRM